MDKHLAQVVTNDASLDDEKLPYDGSTEFVHKELRYLDVGLAVVAHDCSDEPIRHEESRRLRRKIDWHLLPLLCLIYTVQFIDKSTLATSSILGLLSDNHLTTSEFNTLSSAFYIGYLVFSWPQNLALQRFPVGKWLTFNIFMWCVLLGLHPLCNNFGGLFILRFLLGASEGCMTAGLMLVCCMFYTRKEITERIGWTVQCNGFAVIISGFIQFGIAHTSPNRHPRQWQWMMIGTALATFVVFVLFVLFIPDNPTNARFLTPEERIVAVRRVEQNQNGIETKAWKKYQMVEALCEPRTWIFAIYAGFTNLVGGVGIQYSLLIKSFGFSLFQTTLLGIPSGVAQILGISTAGYLSRRFPSSRGCLAILGWIPSITGLLIDICVPISNRVARLVGIYLIYMGTSPFVITMSWVASNTSGHTKKTTTNAIFFVGYALGQTLGSQFWLDKYKPSNRVPFGIILMAQLVGILCTLVLWFMFYRENKRRDALKQQAIRTGVGLSAYDDHAVLETTDLDGKEIKQRVDKTYLDLTDGENLAFRYAL